MMNGKDILPVLSAMLPIIIGAMAPPTIVMMSSEEASLVCVPASLSANENMVGNIMLSPRYSRKKAARAMSPLEAITTDVAVAAIMAQVSNTLLGLIWLMRAPPAKRPTQNSPIPPNANIRLAVFGATVHFSVA